MNTTARALDPTPVRPVVTKPARLLSLDLLRGITIAFMILVNDAGDETHSYWPLQHAAWNGFTPTDLVFPTFLLLVGVSLVLAFQSRISRGASRKDIFLQALRRTVILILLGFLVNSFPQFHLGSLRYYGVLQRIGICYLLATVLLLIDRGWKSKVAICVAALVGYWALMRFVPVPGYGVPTHSVPLLDPDGNLVAAVDRHLFAAKHLYERTRDPEGLLSTIPAVGTILIGVLTGMFLRSSRTVVEKFRGIFFASLVLIASGLLWNIWFPINKKLWTSSYVLFAAGLSLLLFSLTIWLVDIRRQSLPEPERSRHPRWLLPFFVFGVNSIAAYVLSELLAGLLGTLRTSGHVPVSRWLFSHLQAAVPDPALASLIYALLYVAFCWIPIYFLYRKNIYIKV